jgi:hypothetical protein
LYRHALELYLKAIVIRGDQLLHSLSRERVGTSQVFKIHRLSSLFKKAQEVFHELEWTWETDTPGIKDLAEFAELLRGIEAFDPESFAFRYPTNTKGQAALNHHTVFNVIAFSRNMDPILELLDGVVVGLDENINFVSEMWCEL